MTIRKWNGERTWTPSRSAGGREDVREFGMFGVQKPRSEEYQDEGETYGQTGKPHNRSVRRGIVGLPIWIAQ